MNEIKCNECGLKDECPVWTGFCRKYETENIGDCPCCGKKNVRLGRHGNYHGTLACGDCLASMMY